MARGGGKRRTYVRDANGRFASTPGGGLGAARKAARPRTGRTSTLGARTSLKRSRAKLAGRDPADQRLSTALSARAQKGAITRGNKGLKAAKVAARTRIQGPSMAGIIAKRTPKVPPQGDKAEKLKPPSRAKASKTSLPRTLTTIKKAKGLKPQIKRDLINKKIRDYEDAVAKTWNNPDRKLLRAYNRFKGVEAEAYRKTKDRQGDTLKVAKTINTMRKADQFFAKYGAPTTFGNRPIFSTNPGKTNPASRAKGSRTQLPGMDENVNLGNDKVKKKARRQGLSKKPVNKAQLAYLTAKGKARAANKDLRGADIDEKRMANSAAAVVRNMERRRSTAIPKAPPNSPLARQKERHSARWKRANRNYLNAMAQEEVAGPDSKASRSASVAKRASQIYAGRIDPKVKTKARVSKISNFEKPRRRKPKP